MFASLDGKIDGDFFTAPESAPGLAEYARIREFYGCPATIYGTTTMKGGYSDGLAEEIPKTDIMYLKEDYTAVSKVNHYIVSFDPKGILGWNGKYVEKKNRPKAHVIEVLTEEVSADYLAYLRSFDISYIFAGKTVINCGVVLEKLKTRFGIDKVMLAGGGVTNWSFLQEGLIDELSLVVSPVADGSSTSASIFERADVCPGKQPAAFALKNVKILDQGNLWMQYSRPQ